MFKEDLKINMKRLCCEVAVHCLVDFRRHQWTIVLFLARELGSTGIEKLCLIKLRFR